jgi:hydroxyethylthiazole kinase-like uncharacterized protein yjeF
MRSPRSLEMSPGRAGTPTNVVGQEARMRVLTVEQVRALDTFTIEVAKVPARLLMEVAGCGAADLLVKELRRSRLPGPVLVVTGKGNNAGDGFVLARVCAAAGVPVRLLALEAPSDFPPGPARENVDLLAAFGVPVAALDLGSLVQDARGAGVVVDALLGTGILGRVRPPYDAAIEALNACGRPVLALDLPSGLHGDTGQILGCAVRATWTVTFGAWKAGMFVGEGPRCCGIPRLIHLPFSPEAWRRIGLSPPNS